MGTVFTWIAIGFFLLLAIFFFILPGYGFSAWICIGIAGVILCYFLLKRLARRDTMTAKALKTVLSALLIIGILAAGLTCIPICRAAQGEDTADCDYVVVLGAGVHGTVPSLILQNRIDAAVEYLQENPNAVCIVSGGQGSGEDISEASCMYYHITAAGIDGSRIWQEDQSTSTLENFQYSLALIEEMTGQKPEKIAVISNEFHLYRAGRIGEKCGVAVAGVPAKTSYLSLLINYTLREIAAVWGYTVSGGI